MKDAGLDMQTNGVCSNANVFKTRLDRSKQNYVCLNNIEHKQLNRF